MMFDENACIRYLMKEMDPSEELLFKKKMEEDSDLLIEVESLRKVNERLSELPQMKPPAHLTRKILKEASVHYHTKERKRTRSIYYSAAATIMVIFFAGAFLIFEQDNSLLESDTFLEGDTFQSSVPAFDLNSESSSSSVQPWVDNNQELHVNDQFNTLNPAEYDSILNASLQRLQPLNRIETRDRQLRGLHLTGSQR